MAMTHDLRGARSLAERRAAVVCPGVPTATRATAVSASGAHIIDENGRQLIDLVGGIGVTGAGHCPPEVVEAIVAQARTLMHACIHIATYEPYVALCERLVALLPHGGPTKAMLVNSGSEAVENAVKIARQATGRSALICYGGGFHGRTLLGMSLTSKVGYKHGCGPFAPEVYRLPFPSHFHHGDGLSPSDFVARELSRLEDAFSTVVSGDDVAAVILEPVLGEGGFVPVPAEYLRGLRRICDQRGVLLILDEVQTGFGRTGHLGAFQHYGVVPDLSTWAKALGSGLPISAVLDKAEIMDKARPGTVGGTYGGNPVACAGALATLDLIESRGLCARALRLGDTIRARFEALQKKTPLVGDVRGLGAMLAMELFEDGDRSRPASQLTAKILAACLERGVLVIGAGVYGNVVRVLCPLTIEESDLDQALRVIEEEVLRAA
jgi:4-aminobutyrate aminotransferase/(S)-3-amino-2-methylpropionate transaminase